MYLKIISIFVKCFFVSSDVKGR